MIIFDQLRISDDGKRLYVNVHVNNADYFQSYYIDQITIVTADKALETECNAPSSNFIYREIFSNTKSVDLVLDTGSFIAAHLNWDEEIEHPNDFGKPYADIAFGHNNLSQDLFFVFVHCKSSGKVNECFPYIPCELQAETTLGVTFDENLLYQRVMGYTKQLADDCTVPTGFTDFILLWNAFKASVETEHYVPAIKYYNMLFGRELGPDGQYVSYGPFGGGSSKSYGESKPCNCHG